MIRHEIAYRQDTAICGSASKCPELRDLGGMVLPGWRSQAAHLIPASTMMTELTSPLRFAVRCKRVAWMFKSAMLVPTSSEWHPWREPSRGEHADHHSCFLPRALAQLDYPQMLLITRLNKGPHGPRPTTAWTRRSRTRAPTAGEARQL